MTVRITPVVASHVDGRLVRTHEVDGDARRVEELDGLAVVLDLDQRGRYTALGYSHELALDLAQLFLAHARDTDPVEVHGPTHDDSSTDRDGGAATSSSIHPSVEATADAAAGLTPSVRTGVDGGGAAAPEFAAAPHRTLGGPA